MWSLARFSLIKTSIQGISLALLSLIFGMTVHAQGMNVSVGASVISTDFSSSTASVTDMQENTFLVVFHVHNSGELTSKDTMLSLVLPIGWEYHGTAGSIDHTIVQERAYGQLMELELPSIGKDQTKDVSVYVSRTSSGSESDSFFAAITSQNSVPIYTKLSPSQEAGKSPFWSSWFRSGYEYLLLLVNEIWSRFLFTLRYTSP